MPGLKVCKSSSATWNRRCWQIEQTDVDRWRIVLKLEAWGGLLAPTLYWIDSSCAIRPSMASTPSIAYVACCVTIVYLTILFCLRTPPWFTVYMYTCPHGSNWPLGMSLRHVYVTVCSCVVVVLSALKPRATTFMSTPWCALLSNGWGRILWHLNTVQDIFVRASAL